MADELPRSSLVVWALVEVAACVWTPIVPSAGDGELDFSDPDDSGLIPGL